MKLSALLVLILLAVAPAWAQRVDEGMTVYRVVQKVPHALGATVEWRGMALAVKGSDFTLRAGPYRIAVRHASIAFHLHNGDAIRVRGRVTQAGVLPTLGSATVYRSQILVAKASAWNPNVVTQQEGEQVYRWYNWIRSFNRRLTAEVAGFYAANVFRDCKRYQVDPRLALSIIAAESGFEKNAVSKVGAIGLGQLMPDTAGQMGVSNPLDPEQNILGCVRYLFMQNRRWQGHADQMQRVIASYNAGPGAVEQYNGVPPYAETQSYVLYVTSLYRELGGV